VQFCHRSYILQREEREGRREKGGNGGVRWRAGEKGRGEMLHTHMKNS